MHLAARVANRVKTVRKVRVVENGLWSVGRGQFISLPLRDGRVTSRQNKIRTATIIAVRMNLGSGLAVADHHQQLAVFDGVAARRCRRRMRLDIEQPDVLPD